MLALALAGSSALAQDTAAPPVGPPELRDFALPGTPPPAEDAQPAPAEPPPSETAPQQQPPAAEQAPPTEQQAPIAITPPPAPPPLSDQPSSTASVPAAETTEVEAEPLPLPEVQAEVNAPGDNSTVSQPPPSPVSADEETSISDFVWIGAIAGLIAALAGLARLWKFWDARRARLRRSLSVSEMAAQRSSEPAAPPSPPAAEPAAIPAAASVRETAPTALRPRIDILFKPAKAEATETGASVHYELIVKNLGNMPARNVRIEARMFNGGGDQEKAIGAFFRQPSPEKLAARPFEIPARSQAKLSRVVSLDKSEVRAITVQGRQLFIPMVAFNILYDWNGGAAGETGQTSRCFVVGREADSPGDKMAPFRLDLGPRVYRTIGQRETDLARIA